MDTPLAKRMTDRATADALPADHPMRVLAAELDRAARGFYATSQTVDAPRLFGAWASARKAWCAYTGDRLI